MKTAALDAQNEVVIEGDILSNYLVITQVDPLGNEDGAIHITKPCIRAFIKALTQAADSMGA